MPSEKNTPRVEHELFIRSFFAINPPARVATQLASAMRDITLKSGDILYERGEPATHVYFILDGQISLVAPGDEPWEFGADSMLGILDAGASSPYSRTAHVLQDTRAIALTFADYLDVLEDNFEFAKAFLQRGARTTTESSWALAPDGIFPTDFGNQKSFVQSAGARATDPITRLLVLRATPLLKRAPIQALASLARLASERHWAAGETLCEEGSASPVMHLVVFGNVRVDRQSPRAVAATGPNRMVGGVSAFGDDVSSYTAVATEPTVTLEVQKEDFFDIAEDHFGLGRAVFEAISVERARINSALAQRKKEPNA